MFARSLFNEHNKGPSFQGIAIRSVLGKQNRQAQKVYSGFAFLILYIKLLNFKWFTFDNGDISRAETSCFYLANVCSKKENKIFRYQN